MDSTQYYFFGMALVHGGLFFTLYKGIGQLRWPGWRLAVYLLCIGVLLNQIVGIYLVLPALWWPGGLGQFKVEVIICLAPLTLALVTAVIPRKKSESSSIKEKDSLKIKS